MLLGWMFVIGYILMSLCSALAIYSACVIAKQSPRELRAKRRDAVSALDDWRKEQMCSLQVAVRPNLLVPRKSNH